MKFFEQPGLLQIANRLITFCIPLMCCTAKQAEAHFRSQERIIQNAMYPVNMASKISVILEAPVTYRKSTWDLNKGRSQNFTNFLFDVTRVRSEFS